MAAMMPIMATTISNSINVKPSSAWALISSCILEKGGDPRSRESPLSDHAVRSPCYLIATAAFGVGVPDALIAVMAAVCWKIVCASLEPKNRVPDVPADRGCRR